MDKELLVGLKALKPLRKGNQIAGMERSEKNLTESSGRKVLKLKLVLTKIEV